MRSIYSTLILKSFKRSLRRTGILGLSAIMAVQPVFAQPGPSTNSKLTPAQQAFLKALAAQVKSTKQSAATQTKVVVENAAANYCVTGKEGTAVREDLLALEPKLKAETQSWAEAAKNHSQTLRNLRHDLLTNDEAYSRLEAELSKSEDLVVSLRNRLFATLGQLPRIYRDRGQLMIESYFRILGYHMELKLFAEPTRWGLNELREKYALEMSPASVERFFNDGDFSIDGIEIQPHIRENKMLYRLSLNEQNVFLSFVRAAARSPHLKKPSQAYVETVRCVLGRATLGKYALNKALVDQGELGQPLNPEQNFCLGVKAKEFMQVVQHEVDITREMSLRTIVAKELPSAVHDFSRHTQDFLTQTQLGSAITTLMGFPELLPYVLQDTVEQRTIPAAVAAFMAIHRDIDASIEKQYKKTPALEDLRFIWKSPAIQAKLGGVLNNCAVTLKEPSGKALTVDDVWEKILRSDDYYFTVMLTTNLKQIPGRWLEMKKSELALSLRNYILATKTAGSLRAITSLFGAYADQQSADADAIAMAIHEDFSNLLMKEYTALWNKNPALQAWLDGIVEKVEAGKAGTKNFKKPLLAYTEALIQKAQEVAKTMDPNTSVADLPYKEDYVLMALSEPILKLTPDNRRRYDLLLEQSAQTARQAVWKKLWPIMQQEAAQKNMTCDDPGLGRRLGAMAASGLRHMTFGLVDMKDVVDQNVVNQDCRTMKMIAGVTGVERAEAPTDLSHAIIYLTNAQFDDEFIKNFELAYRKQVAAEIMDEFRILDLPTYTPGKFDKYILRKTEQRFWQKVVQIKNAELLQADVVAALRLSIADLESRLKTVINAQSEKDLEFFIKRTKSINVLLGENTQHKMLARLGAQQSGAKVAIALSAPDLGFVFPSLLKYHKEIQDRSILDEEFDHEMWSEFVNANTVLVMAVIGGWVIKHAAGLLPRFTLAPAIASRIDHVGSRMSMVIGAHADYTFMILAAHLVNAHLRETEYSSTQENIESLNRAEGAENRDGSIFEDFPLSPFSLVDKESFLKQQELFRSEAANQNSQFWQTAAFLTLPFLIGRGTNVVGHVANKFRISIEKSFEGIGYFGRQRHEMWMRFGIRSKMHLLRRDFKILGNPSSVEVSLLRSHADRAKVAATTERQREKIEEAYQRIVNRFGKDVHRYMNMPQLQQAYANALYGKGGSVQNLVNLQKEATRLREAGLL
ncbi:MAG: hypothetical protein AB7N80_12120 [Bdellovibrionales bacterium]